LLIFIILSDVEDSLIDYQEPKLAAQCFDLVVNNNQSKRQQRPSIANLNLATLTLPQLNDLADSFSNASSSAMASPRQETGTLYHPNKKNDFKNQQSNAKFNYNSANPQVKYLHIKYSSD